MSLNALNPKAGARLADLKELLKGGESNAALPGAFTDEVLLRLAFDFRRVEQNLSANSSASDQVPSLPQALYVVTSLLQQRCTHAGRRQVLSVPVAGLHRALQLYQLAIEREVVARITEIPSPGDPNSFAQEIWYAASS